MSKSQPGPPAARPPRRHPLLFQQALNEQLFWPGVTLLVLSGALLVWNPAKLAPYRAAVQVALVGSGLILVLTFIFRLRSHVQCGATDLHVQLPFYRLAIPYDDIRIVRPTELYRMFPPERQSWSQRRYLRTLFGATVVVVEMDQLPRSRHWLRLWMSKYMICPDRVGLNLAVRDWIGFRAELDESRARSHRHPVQT